MQLSQQVAGEMTEWGGDIREGEKGSGTFCKRMEKQRKSVTRVKITGGSQLLDPIWSKN